MNYELTNGGILMPENELKVGGVFVIEHVRGGEIINREEQHNLVVDQGLNALLGVMFNGASQITQWYLGLYEGNYVPVAGVTSANIASAATECTAYTETTRPEFVETAPAARSITNGASKATFTFNANKTIYGAFMISDATKAGTSGTLFSAARFSSSKLVVAEDQLLLTYTFTASSS